MANRLEQGEAARGLPLLDEHERLVDKRREHIQNGVAIEFIVRAHRLASVDGEAALEHAESTQQRAFWRVEQLVAPVDRRPQRLQPRQRPALAACPPGEAVGKLSRNALDRQNADARGGQLDRERDAIEVLADLGHTGGVVAG